MATWVLTGGVENFRINVERGFDVIGFKERRRLQASEFESGDEIVCYVTKFVGDDGEPAGQAFGGRVRVTSSMFEDREPIWPQGKKQHPEDYPWRVTAEPITILAEDAFVAVEPMVVADELRPGPGAGELRALDVAVPGPAADDLGGRRDADRGEKTAAH